jgi:hypothetical protein
MNKSAEGMKEKQRGRSEVEASVNHICTYPPKKIPVLTLLNTTINLGSSPFDNFPSLLSSGNATNPFSNFPPPLPPPPLPPLKFPFPFDEEVGGIEFRFDNEIDGKFLTCLVSSVVPVPVAPIDKPPPPGENGIAVADKPATTTGTSRLAALGTEGDEAVVGDPGRLGGDVARFDIF